GADFIEVAPSADILGELPLSRLLELLRRGDTDDGLQVSPLTADPGRREPRYGVGHRDVAEAIPPDAGDRPVAARHGRRAFRPLDAAAARERHETDRLGVDDGGVARQL